MARRGFLAEIQYQMKAAAKEKARAQRESEREYNAAIRQAEQTRKASERAAAKHARAEEVERKRLAKEARDAHVAAMLSEVERRNLQLGAINDEIDSLLAATLGVDDYVDLDALRTAAVHPSFHRADLEMPIPPPTTESAPSEPVCRLPAQPRGLLGLLSGKRHAKAVARATDRHERAHAAWHAELSLIESRREAAATDHATGEGERVAELKTERASYARECSAREEEAAGHNAAIDKLIANLGYGTTEAIQEYVSIVLSNSVYPPHFPVDHTFTFDATSAELNLRVMVPDPETVKDIKAYKYTKSSDEITTTALSQKARKDRYAGAVHQIALRSLHEVFEADRRGLIKTIALEVGTEAIDPATGREVYIPFVATGAERDSFLDFNLASVVPSATLSRLGAAVSKNPFGLIAADTSGIRRL